MNKVWSDFKVEGSGKPRSWAVYTCPNCAGVTCIEIGLASSSLQPPAPLSEVKELQSMPQPKLYSKKIRHLPEKVEGYFYDALKVIDAGVPDAAAVQLRRTLEAAAENRGVSEKTLIKSIEKLIDQGHVTKDFGEALQHIRKIGNIGAHASDERLGSEEVDRALRFTEQLLRNLFEVPGELDEIRKDEIWES